MIKLFNKIDDPSYPDNTYRVTIFADTKDEVVAIKDSGATVKGLGTNAKLAFGSLAITADGNSGWLNSSGEWVF